MTITETTQVESAAKVLGHSFITESSRPLRRSPPVNASQQTQKAEGSSISDAEPQTKQQPLPLNERFLRFTVNPKTHEVIASVIDQETNEVIREIPPEEMRKASEVIRALLGQVVDTLV